MSKKKQSAVTQKAKIKNSKKPKEISIFTILFVLAIIAIIVGIYFGIRYLVITLKYKAYTDKMVQYEFNELYDNKKATAVQNVTNAEMIKVILGSLTNTKDISQIYQVSNDQVSESYNWLEYSEYMGVNSFVTSGELEEKAEKIDAVLLITEVVENILNVEVEQATLKMSENKLSKFTKDEQVIISKAVTLGIIPNKTSALSAKHILKGELNQLVINIVEKYATVYYGSIKINNDGTTQRQDVNIVTDKKELPTNYEDYPYIVDNIDKDIYELNYNILTNSMFKTPKQTYKTMGYLYQQTDELLTKYFNNILNVDYNTITVNGFLENINNYVTYRLKTEDVTQYVNYVKDNKIVLEGQATPLLPIMYHNGEQYVVRTKIDLKVVSSDTNYNLLYGDENSKVRYDSKGFSIYVDVPMGMTLDSNSLRISVSPLVENISKGTSAVVTEK